MATLSYYNARQEAAKSTAFVYGKYHKTAVLTSKLERSGSTLRRTQYERYSLDTRVDEAGDHLHVPTFLRAKPVVKMLPML